MLKAFLSHSSSDKDKFVRKVTEYLGKDNVVYDEFTFEEGEQTLLEILKGLDSSSIFVLFISEDALSSEWVQKEILEAKVRMDENKLKVIYPVIIDKSIKYDDKRIPSWLSDNYNIKFVSRPTIVARRIHTKLRTLSWSTHDRLRELQNLFVGRNDKLEEFEERMHDFSKDKPSVIVVSGFSGVGRRTFLTHALYKTRVVEKAYRQPAILLERDDSIEDLILKLNDTGLIDVSEKLWGLASLSIEEKEEIVCDCLRAAYENKEIVYVLDERCLINYKRVVAPWFLNIINKNLGFEFPVMCVASRDRVRFADRPRTNNKFFFVELNELNDKERARLLNQYLEIYGVHISVEEFEDTRQLLSGLPEQIQFAAEIIAEDPSTKLVDKLPIIAEFNSEKAAVFLRHYAENEDVLEFIRLLAQFEVISASFIFSIVDEQKYYPILETLVAEHVCEFLGYEGEFIRLNDVVRDYIKRNKLYMNSTHLTKVNEKVSEIVNSDDLSEADSTEYVFALKEALKTGRDVPTDYLIPSHYIRCMRDIYYSKGNLDRVIELADVILMKKSSLEHDVVQDIQYYLCLALAKKKDSRMLQEVQEIQGDEHQFLLGFYYRLTGKYDFALERLKGIVDAPFVGSRAKREIVQVYVQIHEYELALEYARKNYESSPNNQFHIQAYFNSLINSNKKDEKSKEIMNRLIEDLTEINSEQSNEMADIASSLYLAKVDGNYLGGMKRIEDCVNRYPSNPYPLLAYCDIALLYSDIEALEKGIGLLEGLSKNKNVSKRSIQRYEAFLLAFKGQESDAMRLAVDITKDYPDETKKRLIESITSCAKQAMLPQ